MSTLAEIEAAADALPLNEKKKLLEFLATRVNGEEKKKAPIEFAKFAGTVRLPEDPLVWQQRVRGLSCRTAKLLRGSLKGTKAMDVFMSERKREREL